MIFKFASIERDAQLLANRIALLKQEEMKTWKKIEETRKRTTDITGLKKRNEEKVQKVSINRFNFASFREINCVLAVRLDQLFTVEFSINFYFNV